LLTVDRQRHDRIYRAGAVIMLDAWEAASLNEHTLRVELIQEEPAAVEEPATASTP
jgi:hypothetical protein